MNLLYVAVLVCAVGTATAADKAFTTPVPFPTPFELELVAGFDLEPWIKPRYTGKTVIWRPDYDVQVSYLPPKPTVTIPKRVKVTEAKKSGIRVTVIVEQCRNRFHLVEPCTGSNQFSNAE